MSNSRQEIELAKRKPATKVQDILNVALDKKSLHKYLMDLTSYSNQNRQPNETAAKAFNRIFIDTLPEHPGLDLLYRLNLLEKIELSKSAKDLYAGARHNASIYSVNEKRNPKLSLEQIFSDRNLRDSYTFNGNIIDKDSEKRISDESKIQLIAETIHRRTEIRDQLKLLFEHQSDFHTCMNIILNFNEDVSNLFPGMSNEQIKEEFDSFQTDFANDVTPDLRVFEVLSAVSSSVSVVYIFNPDEDGLKIMENLRSGVEKFNDLLSQHLPTKADLTTAKRQQAQAYIGTLLEKDFFPNAKLRLLIAEAVQQIEQYGVKKRIERNKPKSDIALQFSADLRTIARKYFSLENKTEAAKNQFIQDVRDKVAAAKAGFATTFKKKISAGGFLARFKSAGEGPKLFEKVDEIISKIGLPKSDKGLSP